MPLQIITTDSPKKGVKMINTCGDGEAIHEPVIPQCNKKLKCGHRCFGVKNETKCMPCL